MEWKQVISVVGALVIFALGQLSIILRERYKKKKEEKQLREYFIEQVKLLEDPITRQVTILKKFIKSLENKKSVNRTLSTVPLNHFHLFKSINYSRLYLSFIEGKYADQNRIEFGKIINKLFNFEDYQTKINRQFQLFKDSYSNINEQYKNNLTKILKIYDSLYPDIGFVEGESNMDFIREWKKLVKKTTHINANNKEYYGIVNLTEHYLIPLSKICYKYTGDINADKVFEYINEVNMLYHDFINLFDTSITIFQKYSDNGEKVYGQIKDSINKLNF